MESGLNTVLIFSLVFISGCLIIFFAFLIQILYILKRLLTKIELRIDNLALTQEEIKFKILNIVEEVLLKVKNYGRKAGEKNEKKDQR